MAHASHDRRRFLWLLGSAAAWSAGACRSARDARPQREPSASTLDDLPKPSVPIPSTMGASGAAVATRADELAAAHERARSLGKPLLIVLFPQPRGMRDLDGAREFGGFLNHATREELALLALAELACGTVEDAERICGVWIGGRATFTLVDAREPGAALSIEPARVGGASARNALAEQRAAAQFEAIRAALLPNPDALDMLAARALARLPDSKRALFEQLADRADALTPEDALAHAALVHTTAARWPNVAATLWATLAAGARQRWVVQRPPGASWAVTAGCGSSIDGIESRTPRVGVVCGIGFVPEYTKRFLCWYEGSPSDESP